MYRKDTRTQVGFLEIVEDPIRYRRDGTRGEKERKVVLEERKRGEEKRTTHKTSKRTTVEPDVHTNISDLSLSSAAYKKVDKKVRPVPTTLPEEFRIVRRAHPDPLKNRPVLPIHPPEFRPGRRFTQERYDALDIDPTGFLWPEERKLAYEFIKLHENCFAWEESEKGVFSPEYFDPILIPTIEHVPWAHKNIPIAPGHYKEIIDIIKGKIESGIYEPSNSSYRSRWFCVKKKDGKSLRLVHDLQPLNAVSIKDAAVPL